MVDMQIFEVGKSLALFGAELHTSVLRKMFIIHATLTRVVLQQN